MKSNSEDRYEKPLIGISRCLLGETVRYDGGSCPFPWITEVLSQHCDFYPVCPEVEAGLGIPRPPVQLMGDIDSPQARGVDDALLDVTEQLLQAGNRHCETMAAVDGIILKARSPSCGVDSTPLYDHDGRAVAHTSGLFARLCSAAYPDMPIIDEDKLATEAGRVGFLIRVFRYRCRRQQGTA
jgi:uncharacterized protein YbbK (DUF523 family)